MEIGTNMGGTLFLFARVAAADACLVSLDLPGGAFGGGYPDWKAPLFRSFARDRQQVHLLRMNSHDPATRERVQALLAGRRLDFLLIDGDHSYEGVKADFEQYRDFVRKGGLIACHDIVPGHEARVGGVARFWQEHRSLYPYREFVGSPVQKGFGIGVWFV
jgi:cephalosporin hydroxylase